LVFSIPPLLALSWLGLAVPALAQEQPELPVPVIPVLEAVSASCPPKAMVTEVHLDHDTVRIRGLALSNQLIAELLEGLDASPSTEAVWLKSIEPEPLQGLSLQGYEIEARLAPTTALPSPAPEADLFVPSSEIPALLTAFGADARSRGLTLTRFLPLPERAWESHVEIPVEIEALGSFEQLLGLLEGSTRSHRALAWRDVELVAQEPYGAQTPLRFRGVLLAYRSSDPQRVPPLALPASTPASPVESWRDPFQSFVRELLMRLESTPPIHRYGLGQLTLLSLDCVEGRAVVLDPDGGRHQLGRGDYLGPHWGQVIDLRCPALVVRESLQGPDGEPITHEAILELALPVAQPEPEPR
jgi:hypothetical protein